MIRPALQCVPLRDGGHSASAVCCLALLVAAPLRADPVLNWPLDCTLGDTCFIQQYTDRDPTPAATDYTCGPLSYDGHKGTDISLLNVTAQRAGVDVRAAAAGIVTSTRSDMTDILQGTPGAPDVDGRECGNGVVLRHPDGWETQYCHMAQGSIRVISGETVAVGQVLGRVGLSGETSFPHLHLSVRRDGAVIDPFDPDDSLTCDTPPDATLWSAPPAYTPGGIISAGFTTMLPELSALRDGALLPAPGTDQPLVFWAYVFGGRAGDTLVLRISGPDGVDVYADNTPLERTLAQLFRAGGRRAPGGGWPAGIYDATAVLMRDGIEIDRATASVQLP